MDNKVKLITPFMMLFAGALASVIMYIRKFDLFTMLWVLLVVLVVFYIIGDVVRYIYESIKPRIIADISFDKSTMTDTEENVVARDDIESMEDTDNSDITEELDEDNMDETVQMADASDEEGYTDDNLD